MKKFYFETETTWGGDGEYITTTKIFDPLRADPDWSGCHWDNPAIVACEQVKDTIMSDKMSYTIRMLGAEECEDDK